MNKKKLRRFIILVFVNIFVLYGVYRLLALFYSYNVMISDNEEVLRMLEKEEKRESELHDTISKLSDPEYLKSYAKENYLYSENGNIVIKIPPVEEKDDEDDE